jgi:hypothetical protein
MKAAILLGATSLTLALAAGSAWAKPAFAPAQTAAERTLERILKLDADKPNDVDPTDGVAGRRPRVTPRPGAAYLKYLTPPLAAAILVAEAREVKANCGGVYKGGEQCGMDSDPILCAQDYPDHYLFRTLQGGPGLAVVEAAWPPDPGAPTKASAGYRLKLAGGVWKIDAIRCAEGGAYNWPAR